MLNNNKDLSKSEGSYLRKPKGYLTICTELLFFLSCFRLQVSLAVKWENNSVCPFPTTWEVHFTAFANSEFQV